MRTGTRMLFGLLTGALVVTGAVAVPSSSAAAEGQSIDWQPCPDAEGVDCATIDVPLDWSEPNGEAIHIGLARRRATDPDNRIGSILMDPGGPGASGVRWVKENPTGFTDEVAERFDVVGFDPRGTGTSAQVKCDKDLSHQASLAAHPDSQDEFDLLVELNKQLFDSCRQHSGALVDHVDTLQVVQDMDAIRAALGERKLNYVGYSYGSLLGQQYAEEFPDRIRAMVMDGNMDHSLRTAWDFMRTETEAVEKNFLEFADWCDTTTDCALYGLDTKAVYADLREQAKAGDLGTDPITGQPMDFYMLSKWASMVNYPRDWRRLATNLKALYDGSSVLVGRTAADELIEYPFPAIWCGDWNYSIADFAEYDALRARLARTFPNIEYTSYIDVAMTCVGSSTVATNPQRPLRIHDAPPLVMIGNVHDYATVYQWSRTAARQSRAHLITYQGWGHTAYHQDGPSSCVNDAVDAYLINLTVPRKGLSCPATEQPGSGSETLDLNPLGSDPYRTS